MACRFIGRGRVYMAIFILVNFVMVHPLWQLSAIPGINIESVCVLGKFTDGEAGKGGTEMFRLFKSARSFSKPVLY